MAVSVSRNRYETFGDCVRIANDVAELYVTTEFGPRVIYYALRGGENFFYTNEAKNYLQKGPAFDEAFYKGAHWDVYGGNRLWRCPHHFPTVFYPDHDPVQVEKTEGGVAFVAAPQITNNVQNRVEVRLDPETSRVEMRYAIENLGPDEKKIGCWALNVCKVGGISVFPQPQTPLGFIPNRHITLWDYSDMRDPRVHWGKKYVTLKGDPAAVGPIKIGINNVDGWAFYINNGACFVQRFQHVDGAEYADFGVSYETYTNPYFLELESLSPLRTLKPGESVTHAESWELFPCDASIDPEDEDAIDRFVQQYVVGRPV